MSLFFIIAVVFLFIAFASDGGQLFFITGIISFLIWAFLFIFGRYGKADERKGSSKGKSGPALTRSPVQVEFVVSDADTGRQVSSGSIGLAIKSQSAKQALADYEKKPTDLNFKRLFEATVVGDDPSQPGDAYAMVFSVLSKLGWGKLDAEDVTAELVSYSVSGTSRKVSDVVSDWCKLQLVKDGQYMYVYESWSGEVAQNPTEVAPQKISKNSAAGDTEKDRMDRVSESWNTTEPNAPSASAKSAPALVASREVTKKASIPFNTNDSADVRNHSPGARQLIEKLASNGLFELDLGEESSFGNFPTRLLCTNYEQRLDPTDNDSRIQKRSIAVNFFGLDSPVKVTAEIIRNSSGIVASKVTWTDALGNNSPADNPDWSSIKENLGLVDEVGTSSAVAQSSAEITSSAIDFGTFAEDLVNQVKWAAEKEDESYAGEVFKEKVNAFLTDAGIDIESKFSFEPGYGDWIAAPDEVLIELITAIRQTVPFLNGEEETDVGIARIQAEIEDCMAENTQIANLDSTFWASVQGGGESRTPHEDGAAKTGIKNAVKIYGNMDWFSPAEQPENIGHLPDSFKRMLELWDEDPSANAAEIAESLSPYISAMFVADNLDGWEAYFDESSYGEFPAESIQVVGFDFSTQPLPLCKAEAWFEVPLKEGVSPSDVEDWIEKEHEGELYSGVTFAWDLDDIEELEDLDLTVGEHRGCEAQLVDLGTKENNESEGENMTKLVWHIDRAKFIFEDADDYESWKQNPEIYFEFSPSSADEDASHLFEDMWDIELYEKVVEPASKLSISLEDDGPLISAWVAFSAETTEDFDQDSFDEWASDGGGWYTGSISLGDFDAHITEDDGGDLRIG